MRQDPLCHCVPAIIIWLTQTYVTFLVVTYLHDAIFPSCYKKLVISAKVATVCFVLESCELSLDLSCCGVVYDNLWSNNMSATSRISAFVAVKQYYCLTHPS